MRFGYGSQCHLASRLDDRQVSHSQMVIREIEAFGCREHRSRWSSAEETIDKFIIVSLSLENAIV